MKYLRGQEPGTAISFQSFREFNLFNLFGKPWLNEINKNDRKNGFAALLKSGERIIDIKLHFPKAGALKPITVRLRNVDDLTNKIFVSDTSMFSPAFTREYGYKNYFTDSIFYLDTNRILVRSILASNKEIGAETYNLISRINDTILVENVYPVTENRPEKYYCCFNDMCFEKAYYLKGNNKKIEDKYLEKWFIQDNQLLRNTFTNESLVSTHFFKIVSNSLMISFLYRYPMSNKK